MGYILLTYRMVKQYVFNDRQKIIFCSYKQYYTDAKVEEVMLVVMAVKAMVFARWRWWWQ